MEEATAGGGMKSLTGTPTTPWIGGPSLSSLLRVRPGALRPKASSEAGETAPPYGPANGEATTVVAKRSRNLSEALVEHKRKRGGKNTTPKEDNLTKLGTNTQHVPLEVWRRREERK